MHIDPDAFKMMMPEWPDYVARDRDSAGTMCHMESSFMVEVGELGTGGFVHVAWPSLLYVYNSMSMQRHGLRAI